MKQLARYIVGQIMRGTIHKSDKKVVRIDGFENLSLYLMICETLSEYCLSRGITFEAKLARGKFISLQDAYPFEAQQMLTYGWVDIDDHMTHYRNLAPSTGENLLVLLLGTDMVEDTGGLDDFFAITPNKVDTLVGQKYASLMSKPLLALYSEADALCQIVNAFFKELFSCVPKNLSRVSESMDVWEKEAPPPEELVSQLYAGLPEWHIPRIQARVPSLSQLLNANTRRQSILQKASAFIRGKTFAKPTKATLAGIRRKFAQYEADGKPFAEDYPEGQSIASLHELLECTVDFVSGNHHPALVQKLLHTDFSIVDDVLSTKLKKNEPAAKPRKLEGFPLTVLLHAMIETMNEARKDFEAFDRLCFRFAQASLCGVPTGEDENGQDSRMILLDAWRNVTLFAGGVVSFIDRESWECEDGADMLTLCQEPEHFLEPYAAEEMLEAGFLKRSTGSTHKVSFFVELYLGEEKVSGKEYLWQIDPNENWVTAFIGLTEMPDEKSYLPFGVMKELNAAFNVKDEDGFAHLVDHSEIQYLQGEESIVSFLVRKAATQEEKDEASRFWKLGERFQHFREAVLHRGFYASIDSETADLVEEYIALARHIAQGSIYAVKMHAYVRFFANAFCIGETASPVMNDIFAERLIMPPWHPATLEKLSDSMLFVLTGISEWYTRPATAHGIDDRIGELVSLSSIHNATDAFVPVPNQVQCFYKTFGYYTLYGQADAKTPFVSAHDIQQREMVFDDDFEDRDMKRMSRESGMILRVLEQYRETFPRDCGTLSLAFVNPTDLQIVVSALYKFIADIQAQQQDLAFSVEVNIITRNDSHGARAYLAYWINTAFSADENIKIKAFLRTYDTENEIPRLLATTLDLVFFFDALDTDSGATYAIIENKHTSPASMTECRFPMVFKPSMAAQGSKEHLIVITQNQFFAATAHTQLLRAYLDHAAVRPGTHYDLVQSATISESRGQVIQELQKRTVWLVCVDSAIDKKTVRELYAEDTGIIGFTTGEGSFGQLNMAITCRPDVKMDMLLRCCRRLRGMFPSWSDVQLQFAAEHCMNKARTLDGVSILRALNPDDYDINNYLAYLIASELTSAETHQLNVLIRLDSYRHWFKGEKQDEKKIPDFLHLTADLTPGSHLCFHATIIESKISRASSIKATHLPKAKQQVEQGMRILREHFEPHPERTSVEHRYWLAQLYRALVFLQGDIELDDSAFTELSAQLSSMLEGDFEVVWDGQILACEIDNDSYLYEDEYEGIPCLMIGQRAIQNILLKRAPEDTSASFDAAASVGTEEENPDDVIPAAEVPIPLADEESPLPPAIAAQPDSLAPDELQARTSNQSVLEELLAAQEEAPEPDPAVSATRQESSGAEGELSDVRVLIGKDQAAQPVYWEFGHKQLPNRHLLITGGSGQGKTYAIQTFLYELSRQKISSVVFDYTDGFLPDKLEPPFAEALGDRVVQHIAVVNPIPINPFKRQTIEVAGMSCPEKTVYTAGRFAAIMKHVYGFGEQQYSALYTACKDGIDRHGEKMSFTVLRRNLENASTTYAKTVLSKMQMLFDLDIFDTSNAFDWSKITERDGKVTVIQLTNLDRESQTIITEMLMWDAWYALTKIGSPAKPFVVVLDEAQNLSIADGSPAQKILQEGRKFGWSAWFATQFLKGALDTDEISRLYQAAVQLYFKPSSEEVNSIAQMLSSDAMPTAGWVSKIKQMQKGQCIVHGSRIGKNGVFGAYPATMVKVSSFDERE